MTGAGYVSGHMGQVSLKLVNAKWSYNSLSDLQKKQGKNEGREQKITYWTPVVRSKVR